MNPLSVFGLTKETLWGVGKLQLQIAVQCADTWTRLQKLFWVEGTHILHCKT